MCVFVYACVCVYTCLCARTCAACLQCSGRPEEGAGSSELDLQVALRFGAGAGNQTGKNRMNS